MHRPHFFLTAFVALLLAGSAGGVDVLGQWTDTNPDPLRIGYDQNQMQQVLDKIDELITALRR